MTTDTSGIQTIPTTVVGLQGRPVAATAPAVNQVLQYNGTQWVPASVSGVGGGSGTVGSGSAPQLAQYVGSASTTIGGVTISGDATIAAGGALTINPSAVIYTKIQNVTATRLLGNPTGTAGPPSEISLGTGLSFSGSVLNASSTGSGTVGAGTVNQLPVYTGANAVAGDAHVSETGTQTFINYNAASGTAWPAFGVPPNLRVTNADGTAPAVAVLGIGFNSACTLARIEGPGTAPISTGGPNGALGSFQFSGWDGTNNMTPSARFIAFTTEAFAAGTPAHHGTRAEIATTATGTATMVPAIGFEQDGGITVPPSVTGGSHGAGSINAQAYFLNGSPLTAGGAPGGAVGNAQYYLNSTTFGGSTGLTLGSTSVTAMTMGLSGTAVGDTYYAGAGGALTRLPAGTVNYVLTSGGPLTPPSWQVAPGAGGGITGSGTSPQAAYFTGSGSVGSSAGMTMSAASVTAMNMALGTDATGDMYYRAATGALTRVPPGTAVQVLHGAAGAPTWGAVTLTTDIAGILPVLNGGTGSSTTGSGVTSATLSSPGGIFAVTGTNPITGIGTFGYSTTGTSGGIPYFSSTSALSSSGALTANGLVLGGSPPTSLAVGATNTVLHGNTGAVPTFGAITGPEISNGAVTYARMQTTGTAAVLLGASGAAGSTIGEITLGTNLSFAGNVLNATGAGGGVGAGVVNQLAVYNSTSSVAGDAHISETGTQTLINYNAASGAAFPPFGVAPNLRITNLDGSAASAAILGIGFNGAFTLARVEGPGTAPVATAGPNGAIGALQFSGWDGTNNITPSARLIGFTTETFATGTPNHHGARMELATTPTGTATMTAVIGFEANGGITVPPSVTGAGVAAGTINAQGYYVNGAQIGGFSESVGWLAGANPTNAIVFTNNTGRTITVVGIVGMVQVVESAAMTIHVYKQVSGTASLTSGTQLDTTAFSGTVSAGTAQTMLSGGTVTLAAGDRIGLNVATGTPTLCVGTITVYLQ